MEDEPRGKKGDEWKRNPKSFPEISITTTYGPESFRTDVGYHRYSKTVYKGIYIV